MSARITLLNYVLRGITYRFQIYLHKHILLKNDLYEHVHTHTSHLLKKYLLPLRQESRELLIHILCMSGFMNKHALLP